MKLDLHTHCYEASTFAEPTEELVKDLVDRIRARGLDGIAITDHDYFVARKGNHFACKVQEIVARDFPDITIIPGQEIWHAHTEVVELYLTDTLMFRFLVHPGFPSYIKPDWVPENIQGVEIDNALHHRDLQFDRATELADRYDLVRLRNSDAHRLSDIGENFNEMDLEVLYSRAVRRPT